FIIKRRTKASSLLDAVMLHYAVFHGPVGSTLQQIYLLAGIYEHSYSYVLAIYLIRYKSIWILVQGTSLLCTAVEDMGPPCLCSEIIIDITKIKPPIDITKIKLPHFLMQWHAALIEAHEATTPCILSRRLDGGGGGGQLLTFKDIAVIIIVVLVSIVEHAIYLLDSILPSIAQVMYRERTIFIRT
ncbi:hypothetical protein ACJX0J_031909, partial [Zea mays]